MNTNGYLIDNELVFIPSQKIIKSITTNKNQTLHAPAVRCLQLLIESKATVPQAQLYKAGWGDDALKKVSTATYYQCFVNLRKQLREVGYSRELLITVPKEGMKINDAIEITAFTPLPERQDANKTETPLSDSAFKGMRFARLRIAVLILAVTGGLLFAFMFVSPTSGDHSLTLGGEQYQRYPELPQCVYIHPETSAVINVEHASQFILAKELSCDTTKIIFIHQGKVRTSVFHCTENMRCHSLTYMNKPS